MSATTGPIAAAVLVVAGNAVIVQDKPPTSQTRVIVGGIVAGAGLALWEKAMPQTAVAFSWLVLLTVLLVRVDPTTPAPLESIRNWLQE